MIEAGFGWRAPGWFLPAGGILAVALVLLVWGYARSRLNRKVSFTLPLLKLAGILLLGLCLAEPMVHGVRVRPGANAFVILADNSQSMEARDEGDGRTRSEMMKQALGENSAWQQHVARDFDLRRYLFDARLRAVSGFEDLDGSGNLSSLHGALATIAKRFDGESLAGILLFSDGIATDEMGEEFAETIPAPLYPVLMGQEGDAPDLRVERVTVNQSNFESAPVTLQAYLNHRGFQGENLHINLFDESGTAVDSVTRKAGASGRETARFELRPETPGIHFYRVEVGSEPQDGDEPEGEADREITGFNNRRTVAVDRGGGPYRVLYVCGRPNWEFKFLRRALADDAEIDLVGLLRIARREPKFDFRSRYGETTNPIFRGFENQEDEEAEQYDEPVLIRMGTEDADELRAGFPREAEDLFRYDALILDDVEAAFFTQDQLSLIRDFVSRRGGGFLMLGGQESFDRGEYDRTPIADLLPVYLDGAGSEGGGEAPIRYDITREGLVQPWVRLRKTEDLEARRLEEMPAFATMNRMPEIKPGALELARARNAGGEEMPALVTQRFGQGRVAAIMIGDMWRWSLQRTDTDRDDPSLFWRQTLRWLVASVPHRVEVETRAAHEDPGTPVQLSVRVRDAEFDPLDNATVEISVIDPEGEVMTLAAETSTEEPGLYQAELVPRKAGGYRARVKVTDPDGQILPGREAGWVSEPAAREFSSLAPNRALLERLAAGTGGEMVNPGALQSFAESLAARLAPETEAWSKPLWHRWTVLLLAIACLAGEWGLRRWKGLP